MTNGAPIRSTRVGQLTQFLESEALKLFLVTIIALILVLAAAYLAQLALELSLGRMLLALGMVVIMILGALFASGIIARMRLADELQSTLGKRVQQLNDMLAEKTRELDSLVQTISQLKELMKENKQWLVDDQQVLKLESSTSRSIYVVVPDFYYERDNNYLKVIATNLSRADGPTYYYLLPHGGEIETEHKDVTLRLADQLKGFGVADPTKLIENRFKVKILTDPRFLDFALYGMAIYDDVAGEVHCLQYLPREIGAINVAIPMSQDLGRRLVDRARALFYKEFLEPQTTTKS